MRISSWVVRIALLWGIVACAKGAEIFWNDNAGIHRSQDTKPLEPKLLFETFDTRGLDIDVARDRLVWSDVLPIAGPGPGGVIRSGSVQGGEIDEVARWLPSPAGVAIDTGRRRLYWTDLGDGNNPSAVYSANLDGTDARRIISAVSLSEIADISIDTTRDQLYFTYVNPLIDALYAGGIARADLDGSNWQPIVGGLGKPLGLAVDSAGGEVYWADAGLSEGQGAIQAASLDGQHQRIILGGLAMPFGVALDLAEQNVYWTDKRSGKIQRTGMPGVLPYFEDVVTGLVDPTALAILNGPLTEPAWNVDADGNWSAVANWRPRVPDAAGDRAIFGEVITSPRTVTVDRPVTVGRIELAASHGYTIAGPGGITLDVKSGDAFIQVAEGHHLISAPLALADDTVFTVIGLDSKLTVAEPVGTRAVSLTKAGAGTLALNGLQARALSVNGGTLAVGRHGPTSVLGALKIAGNPSAPLATVDMGQSALVIDYLPAEENPATVIRQQILAGRGGPGFDPSWTGTGITSTQVQADVAIEPNSTSVAYADNATLPLGPLAAFRGQAVDLSAVLVGYTRTGDANLDGVVNDDDVTIVGATYAPGVPRPSWSSGDFDYNGFVDDEDVTLLGAFYDPAAAPLASTAPSPVSAATAVPEPSTAALLCAVLASTIAAVLRCRARRNACCQ